MRTETTEFIRGLFTLAISGFILSKLINPESFGGWVGVILLTLIVFAILKAIGGAIRKN